MPNASEPSPKTQELHALYPLSEWQNWLPAFLALQLPKDHWSFVLQQLQPENTPPDLLTALWQGLRKHAEPLPPLTQPAFMDCCGTGGSGRPHFNTSTTVAFVLAAGGVPVLKFGNRAITSASGSFDFLEAVLELEAPLTTEQALRCYEQTGLGFLMAPQVYPRLAAFQTLRKACGVSTVLNYLGPLLHPYTPAYKLLGVSNPAMLEPLATLLQATAPQCKAVVLSSSTPASKEGLDELEPTAPATGFWLAGETAKEALEPWAYTPQPESLSTAQETTTEAIDYSSPTVNAAHFKALVQGEMAETHPVAQLVYLNAGLGFYLAGQSPSWEAGKTRAKRLLKQGKVTELWLQVKQITH